MTYEDTRVECAYRLDLLVDGKVVVEVKSVDRLSDVHRAQMLSYLRLTGLQVGLVFNFNVKLLAREGIMRVVDRFDEK